ncbi:MAG TPA: glycosyltransferase family 4 protein [Chloroflexota bacterium]|nr:glycosyltransferase family 4 protein [Chloroflexota bacterium]
MRICLASIHPRLLSGQIDSLTALARGLRDNGHDVALVSAFAEQDLLDERRAFGEAAEPGQLLPRLARLSRIWSGIERAAETADLVHLNLPTPSFTPLANLLQHRIKKPLIVGFEAHLICLGDVLPHGRWLASPKFYLPRLLVNNRGIARAGGFQAAHYVVASGYQAEELLRAGAPFDRISAIPTLFDWARLAGDGGAARVALPTGQPLIGYIGHFNHVKGVDVLIRALPRIRERFPGVQLALAWSGLGEEGPVKRAIAATGLADQVQVLGRVSVAEMFSRCDLAVLPYRLTIGQAAFPGLVLEAMAVGTPLVTTDLPLLRELVAEEELALLARPEDPSDLADKVCQLLANQTEARAMVERQRAAIRTRLDPTVLVERYEELYAKVVSDAARRQTSLLRTT